MKEKLVEKDYLILDALKEDASRSSHQISKLTGIPITTVHNHIKKLRKGGIIKKYTVELDNKKMGRNVSVYVLVTTNYAYLKKHKIDYKKLCTQITKNPNVENVSVCTGGIDLIVKAVLKDIEELNGFVANFLRGMDGIARTQTLVILSEY